MRKQFLIAILALCCMFSFFQTSELKASHIAALNITYTGVDTFQYVVTIKVYRDCSNLNSVPNVITLLYQSVLCGLIDSVNIPLAPSMSGLPGSGSFIKLPCLGIDTCDPSLSGYAVEEFVYQDTIVLPAVCTDWIISYQTAGFRNANNVIDNATNKPIYVNALLNNADAPGNSSPNFEKPPVAIFCVDRDFYFDQGAVEPDGDSLVYSLAPAQGFGGIVLTYISPYTFLTPFDVAIPPLNMDPVNGIISFKPTGPPLRSVMCVLIEEYNNSGVLIGSVKNDMQVYINDSCVADTLNFVGDTTVPTGAHPAITALCLDPVIVIHFDHPIQCETIALDGSDFILTLPIGGTLSIDSIGTPNCTGGLIDSLVLYLSDSLRFNGSYYVSDTIGTDGTPVLSECGLPLNDTLEIRLNNCVKAYVDLKNVTVENNDSIRLVWSKQTENFQYIYFTRYDLYRSLAPFGIYDSIASVFSIDDTVFSDKNVTVVDTPYNYMVKMKLDPALFLNPVSDSIKSIHLQGVPNLTDTMVFDLFWTKYWGWPNPRYELLESIDYAPWKQIAITDDPIVDYSYAKPLLANSYRLIIRTKDNVSGLVSYSNWIDFEIPVKDIPNVFSPNHDGINDYFFVNEMLLYKPVHLIVYNRWGMKVFEDENYENNWDGDNLVGRPLEPDTYFYVLKMTGGDNRAGFVTIVR